MKELDTLDSLRAKNRLAQIDSEITIAKMSLEGYYRNENPKLKLEQKLAELKIEKKKLENEWKELEQS